MLLLVITIVTALIVASPAIQQFSPFPQTEAITELFLLGPYRNATYPFNVTIGENYRLYINVNNSLGSSAYYTIQMKFRSQSQSAPDVINGTFSQQPSLCNTRFFVENNEYIELPIDVAFEYELDEVDPNVLNMKYIFFNGTPLSINSTKITRDPTREGFLGNLFFELWIFNSTTNDFQYHERYVSLWLKMNTS